MVDTYDIEAVFSDTPKTEKKFVRLQKDCGKKGETPHLSLRLGKIVADARLEKIPLQLFEIIVDFNFDGYFPGYI